MTLTVFDSLETVEVLEKSGFDADQARAICFVIRRSRESPDMATKQDVVELRTELKQDIAELRTELKQDIAELRAELKQDITELRTELKQDVAELKQDITGLRHEVDCLRKDMDKLSSDMTLKLGTMVFGAATILGIVLGILIKFP